MYGAGLAGWARSYRGGLGTPLTIAARWQLSASCAWPGSAATHVDCAAHEWANWPPVSCLCRVLYGQMHYMAYDWVDPACRADYDQPEPARLVGAAPASCISWPGVHLSPPGSL